MNPELKSVSAIGRYLFFTPLLFITVSLHATIDFGVSEIITPIGGCGMGEEYIVVEIKNYGNVSVDGFPVSFQVNGGAIYTEMVLLPLDDGDSTINYFGIPYDFSVPGFYTIRSWTDGDSHPENDSTTIVIESLATPAIDLGPDLSVCSTQILDAGNAGSDYAWSTGATTQTITVDISGSYSVTITNPESGCTATDNIDITISDLPEVAFNYMLDDLTCTFTNTSLYCDTYLWDFGDDMTSTEENPVHIYAAAGSYDVKLSGSNVCSTDESNQTVSWPVTILSAGKNIFSIAPNPAIQNVHLLFLQQAGAEIRYEMLNYRGEIISSNQITSGDHEIDISKISTGLYVIYVMENDRIIAGEKLIVQH